MATDFNLPCLTVSVRVYNLYGPSVEDAEAIARDAMDDMKYEFGRLMPQDEDGESEFYDVMDYSVSVTVD